MKFDGLLGHPITVANSIWDGTVTRREVHVDPGDTLTAAAIWAEIAKVALNSRDDAIRACVESGESTRTVGTATGLSHTAISRIAGKKAS